MVNPQKHFGRLGNNLFQFSYIYSQFRRGEILDIFVQSPEYFDSYEEEIKDLFGRGDGSESYVAIHLRQGKNPMNPSEPEYSKNPFYFNLAESDYYEKAMALFPNEKFLVFSDDIDFARNYFIGKEYEFDETKEPIEVLTRISNCKSVIVANSSFSWWGGFLCCPQDNYKIIAPSNEHWYNDGVERTKVPSSWIRI